MTQCSLDGYPGLLEKHPLLIAGILHRDFGCGRDGAPAAAARERR